MPKSSQPTLALAFAESCTFGKTVVDHDGDGSHLSMTVKFFGVPHTMSFSRKYEAKTDCGSMADPIGADPRLSLQRTVKLSYYKTVLLPGYEGNYVVTLEPESD